MNITLLSFLTSLSVWGMVTKAFALEPFDGRPLRVDLPKDKAALLENGEPVTVEVTKQQGRALVIVRDVEAPTHICMGQITDLRNYPAITPFLKDVDIYDDTVFANGTHRLAAKFSMQVMGMSVDYCILFHHHPPHNTFTWRLDQAKTKKYVEENVGHWEVLPHPLKRGWSRILYSTQLQFPKWIPQHVMSIVSQKSLFETTSKVKQASESEAHKREKEELQ